MENTTEPDNLRKIYNIVDWIDLGLVGAIILYYGRLVNSLQYELPTGIELDYAQFFNLAIENANLIGIGLLVASLAVCITFIYLTVKMRRKRQIGVARATVRIIWNGIWIPLDIYALCMILLFRIGG